LRSSAAQLGDAALPSVVRSPAVVDHHDLTVLWARQLERRRAEVEAL
jgi:hypothetical protein